MEGGRVEQSGNPHASRRLQVANVGIQIHRWLRASKLFECLIQAEAYHWRNRREVVDRKEDVPWFASIDEIDENRLPCLGETGGRGCDLKATLASKIFAFRKDFQVAGSEPVPAPPDSGREAGLRHPPP